MVFTHHDVPGIIGRVGTIFGKHKINIAQMAVGRASAGGAAIGVLNLDQEPTEAALAEVLASPDIHTAASSACHRQANCPHGCKGRG